MSVALFLSGGAPNLTFMAGGLYELETLGVEYTLVSTSGAGMLIGLLYAAPPGTGEMRDLRLKALQGTVEMYVDDRIFDFMERFWFFPVNYKVFHKPGAMAEVFTRFYTRLLDQFPDNTAAQRLAKDWLQLILATVCPTDLGLWSKGTCQPAPFIYDVVDFAKLKSFAPDFVMNAYCLEDRKMQLFGKAEITAQHFQAALAFPYIYAPHELNGKTYIEGSAVDTICFEPVFEYLYQPTEGCAMERTGSGKEVPSTYQARANRPKVDTLLVFNMLGHEQLIRKPSFLLDALSQEIIVPLVPLTKDDIRIFSTEHLPRYKRTNPNLELLEVKMDLRESEWRHALDWSRRNGENLFQRGREAARRVYEAHKRRFTGEAEKPRRQPRSNRALAA
jgi:predicted acylesterase/phospholipase RssA